MKDKDIQKLVQFLQGLPHNQVLIKELIISYFQEREYTKLLLEEVDELSQEIQQYEDYIEENDYEKVTIH
jgi:uncharacterized membrane protein YgcG